MIYSSTQHMGLKVHVDDITMSKTIEDWSEVRSPSRAKRRMKRGFKQRVAYRIVPKTDIYKFGDTLMMHSEIYKEFLRKIEQSKSNNAADDLSFRGRSESKSEEFGFGINPFWKSGGLPSYSSWLYS